MTAKQKKAISSNARLNYLVDSGCTAESIIQELPIEFQYAVDANFWDLVDEDSRVSSIFR